MLRSLFKERYGSKFEIANVELLPGNLVNYQLKENLGVNSVPDYLKHELINEIAEEYALPLGFQDFRQSFRPQYQQVYLYHRTLLFSLVMGTFMFYLMKFSELRRESMSHLNFL